VIESIKKLIQKKSSDQIIITEKLQEYLDLLENTNDNYFITGKAGTGKTTLIDLFRKISKKKIVVLAPTGLAAINAKGQTIHSFFKFPPRMISKDMVHQVYDRSLYSEVDTIIIDEASMLRADMLDAIEVFMRLNGRDKNNPFGGAQIILVGDLFQLPPVVSSQEQDIYSSLYETPYFFSAGSFNQELFRVLLLDEVFRQKDQEFVELLNMIREGDASLKSLEIINKRTTNSNFEDDHIILCPTNAAADGINEIKLNAINSPVHKYEAVLEGSFVDNERYLPVSAVLKLKKGARVLFTKNDMGGKWVNGSLGKVHSLEDDVVQIRLDSGQIVDVEMEKWSDIRYKYNEETREIEEEEVGSAFQYPLKLAWAITIHKSQGMTFDKVCLDFRKSPFAHGQTYVALSRCRTLEGITLTKNIYPNDLLVDTRIIEFYFNLKN